MLSPSSSYDSRSKKQGHHLHRGNSSSCESPRTTPNASMEFRIPAAESGTPDSQSELESYQNGPAAPGTIALFTRDEIEIGKKLGSGEYCEVFEVRGIHLMNKIRTASDDVCSVWTRNCIAQHATFKNNNNNSPWAGDTRYCIKFIKPKWMGTHEEGFDRAAMHLENEISILCSLSLESKRLTYQHAVNICTVRGLAMDGMEAYYNTGRYDSFFVVLDRYQESLEDRLAKWRKRDKLKRMSSGTLAAAGAALRRLGGGQGGRGSGDTTATTGVASSSNTPPTSPKSVSPRKLLQLLPRPNSHSRSGSMGSMSYTSPLTSSSKTYNSHNRSGSMGGMSSTSPLTSSSKTYVPPPAPMDLMMDPVTSTPPLTHSQKRQQAQAKTVAAATGAGASPTKPARRPRKAQSLGSSPPKRQVNTGTLLDRLEVAYDMARALEFVHVQKIVHRDLRPNVFAFFVKEKSELEDNETNSHSANMKLKESLTGLQLMDFSCSQRLSDQEDGMLQEDADDPRSSTLNTTHHYHAPEVLWGERYDTKADVFSFTTLLCEVVTLKELHQFDVRRKAATMCAAQLRAAREPTEGDPLPTGVLNLLEQGWSIRPNDRPTMSEVCDSIRAVLLTLGGEGHALNDDFHGVTVGERGVAGGNARLLSPRPAPYTPTNTTKLEIQLPGMMDMQEIRLPGLDFESQDASL